MNYKEALKKIADKLRAEEADKLRAEELEKSPGAGRPQKNQVASEHLELVLTPYH